MDTTYTIQIWSRKTLSYRKEWNGLTPDQLPAFFSEHVSTYPRTSMQVYQRNNFNFILRKE